jgi:hypothetical protein
MTPSPAETLAELWLPLLHALATVTMLGVILTCQLVHYPLFAKVPPSAFASYEREHMRRIFPIVAPAMLAEGLTAAALAINPPTPIADRNLEWLLYTGAALVLVNAASTTTLQGPYHQRLAERGHDTGTIARLVNTNLIRTAAWAARAPIALAVLALTAAG